jgi:acetyl esterase/lipase
MKHTILWMLSFCILLISCQKDDDTPPDNSIPEKTELNVSYGSNAAQKMDVYLPSNRSTTTTKVMILIHGGGWNQGDKTDFAVYVDTLKKRLPSYAIFNINYRLANAPNIFPAQELDVKAAIEFIYNKRTEYGISDKFVLLGASAGGHLALLHAYKYTSPVKIKAVVDFFGPTDLVEMYNNPINPLIPLQLSAVTGGNPTSHAPMYQQSSPINFVTPQASPTILLHGGADIVVAPSQSLSLQIRLLMAGVPNQYVFYPAENHGWVGANLTDSFNKIVLFLSANVN